MKNIYRFEFSLKAEFEFAKLAHLIQKRIIKKLDFFEALENPLSLAKKLTGRENTFRFRVGDYRIIVSPQNKNIFVILVIIKIAHRKEVYN